MNDAGKLPAADVLDADAQFDAELVPGSRLGLYFAVGLGAGAVIALQIDVMRVFSVGSWAHFGSLVVSLAMLGFGLASATMTVAKDWFAPPLARRRHLLARAVRAARGRRQPLCAASRLQRHLPGVRPGAKVEAVADFPRRADAVPGRRVLPRMRFPQEQSHIRSGLFRRSCRRRTLRPRRPVGDVRVHACQFDRRAVGAVVRGLPGLDVRPRRTGHARSICRRRRGRVRRPFRRAADAWA